MFKTVRLYGLAVPICITYHDMQWMGLEARYGSPRADQESISIHMQIANNVSSQSCIHTQSSECVSAQRAEKHLHAEC